MPSQTELSVILTAKDRMSAALKSVQNSSKSAYRELQSLQRLKSIGIKVDPQRELQLATKNVKSLKANLAGLQAKKDLIKPGQEAELSRINTQINNVKRNLALAQGVASKLSLSGRLGQSLTNVGGKLQNLSTKFQGISRAGQLAFAGVSKITFDYEKGVARLGTISGVSAGQNEKLAQAVSRTAAAMGSDPVESLEAAYQGFSSSLIKTSKDAAPVIASMTKMAKIGGTEVTSAMDLASSAINAYGLKTRDINKVSDIFINTQNKGKTTVNELAQSFGQVGPLAAALGVDLKQLSAGYITLTKQGVSTAESTTQLKAVFSQLSSPSGKLAEAIGKVGISFKDFEKQGGTLPEYLKKLKGAVGGSDVEFQNMFTNLRAKQGVIGLTKNGFRDLDSAMKDANNSVGATNSTWQSFNLTPAQQFAVAINQLKEAGIQVGLTLVPALTGIANWLTSLDPTMLTILVGAFTSLSLLSPALSALSTIFTTLGTVFTALAGEATLLDIALSPIALTIGAIGLAIAAGVVAWQTNFMGFRDFLQGLWANITLVFTQAWETISMVWSAVRPFFMAVWSGIQQVFSGVAGFFGSIFMAAWNAVQVVWSVAGAFFNAIWSTIRGIFSVVAGVLSGDFGQAWNGIKQIWSGVVSFFSGIWQGIVGVFSAVGTILGGFFISAKNIIVGAWNSMTGFFGQVVMSVISTFSRVVSGISGYFASAVSAVKGWFNGLVSWVSAIPGRIVGFFSGIGGKIKGAIAGAVRSLPGVGGAVADFFGLAVGGSPKPGQIYRVNEQGQESVTDKFGQTRLLQGDYATFNRGDRVNTAGATRNKMENQSGNTTISPTININNTNGLNENQVADIVMQRLEQLMN